MQGVIDELSLQTTDTTFPYTYNWDTTNYWDGSHSITAIAYEAAGNSFEDIKTVTTDNGIKPPPKEPPIPPKPPM